MMNLQRRRRGFSLVESVLSSLILAVVAIPLLSLLVQERTTTQKSSLTYLCVLAAREEGYRSLMRLNSRAFLETPTHQAPHIKFDWLKDGVEGLIAGLQVGVDTSLGINVGVELAHLQPTALAEPHRVLQPKDQQHEDDRDDAQGGTAFPNHLS